MSKNYVQQGAVLSLVIAAGCSAGDAVIVNSFKGVALEDIAATESGSVALDGVWSLPKTAVTIAAGEPAYLTSAGNITNVSTSNTLFGVFAAAAESGDAEASVRLSN